jgi:hypothetical protein
VASLLIAVLKPFKVARTLQLLHGGTAGELGLISTVFAHALALAVKQAIDPGLVSLSQV